MDKIIDYITSLVHKKYSGEIALIITFNQGGIRGVKGGHFEKLNIK